MGGGSNTKWIKNTIPYRHLLSKVVERTLVEAAADTPTTALIHSVRYYCCWNQFRMLTTLAILSIQIFQFLEIGDQQQIAAQMSGNRINARQIVVGGIKRLTITDQKIFK